MRRSHIIDAGTSGGLGSASVSQLCWCFFQVVKQMIHNYNACESLHLKKVNFLLKEDSVDSCLCLSINKLTTLANSQPSLKALMVIDVQKIDCWCALVV